MRDTTADFSTVRDDIAELRSQINTLVSDLKAAAMSKASELSHDVPERGAEAVRDRVREAPLAALAVSFVAGCVVARLWR
jgi:ElaB/YqjD/DUF883 family membrane-anchored ribosome-binding protein